MMVPTMMVALFLWVAPPLEEDAAITSRNIDTLLAELERNRTLCGPLSLWVCLRCLGHHTRAEAVVGQAHVSKDGMPLDQLLLLAQRYEQGACAIILEQKSVESLPTPSILVLGGNHCVAYLGMDPETGRARVVDPSRRLTGLESLELLQEHWSGETIVFSSPPMSVLGTVVLNGLAGLTVLVLVLVAGALRIRERKGTKGVSDGLKFVQ